MFGISLEILLEDYRLAVKEARLHRKDAGKAAHEAIELIIKKIHDSAFWAAGGEARAASERDYASLDSVEHIEKRVNAAESLVVLFGEAIKMDVDYLQASYWRINQQAMTDLQRVRRKR